MNSSYPLLVIVISFALTLNATTAEKPAVQQRLQVAQGGTGMAYGGYASQVPEEVDATDASERLLILTPRGPLVVRLEVTIDGLPFRTEREKTIDSWLKQTDKNEDGESTWEEVIASPQFGSGRFAAYLRNEKTRQQFVKNYDRDKDGKLSRYECRLLLSGQFGGPVFTMVNNSYGYAAGPQLFALLDVDDDKILSAKEIAGAAQRLQSRDKDENDIVDASELGIASGGARFVRRPAQPRQVMPLLGLIGRSFSSSEVHRALLTRYGDEERISATRLGLVPALPVRLDKDEDSFISEDELQALNEIAPHLHLRVEFGELGDGPAGFTLVKVSEELGSPDNILRKTPDKATLDLGETQLEMLTSNMPLRTYNYANTAQTMLTRYDSDKNGYLEWKELEKNRQATYFKQQFKAWDEDQDGKVFAEEIAAAYLRMLRPQRYRVSVAAANFGGSLFTVADANGDGRLGLRDMLNVSERIKTFDKDKDGEISQTEIPRTIRFAVARGSNAYTLLYPRGVQRVAVGPNGKPVTSDTDGPEWFVRMDRNGDGDVTLKEFLGDEMQFRQLDTNKDGFIERAEAEAAES